MAITKEATPPESKRGEYMAARRRSGVGSAATADADAAAKAVAATTMRRTFA